MDIQPYLTLVLVILPGIMKFATCVFACLAQLFAGSSAAATDEWKTRNIYFALTDRIARNSDDSGGNACSNLGRYCGGTWKGLEGKLDYIQGMGFDAIWISPIVESTLINMQNLHDT